MASEVETRVVGGEEQHAIWVPITAAEGAALRKKAQAENINIRYLVANLLRGWMGSGGELSVGDLDRVVGGVTAPMKISLSDLASIHVDSRIPPTTSTSTSTASAPWTTLMCAW